MNIVNIKIIRHGYSTANEYTEINSMNPTSAIYRNAGLSDKGIEIIEKNKKQLKSRLADADIILTSPLKRAIQTALLIYDTPLPPNLKIRIVPIFSEIGNLIENKGVSRKEIMSDPNLNKYTNFNKLDLSDNLDNLFYYDYGWKNQYDRNVDYNQFTIIPNSPDTWTELNSPILSNCDLRLVAIKNFLASNIFSGKKIIIFSHCDLIRCLIGKCPDNLGIVNFKYNQDTQNIFAINIEKHPINSKNEIRILSYNVSWEAMEGKKSNTVIKKCSRATANTATDCLQNVVKFIDNNKPYDFIGLQEASEFPDIYKKSQAMENMGYIYTRPELEHMVTLYNKEKYTLDTTDGYVLGYMQNPGRPFIVSFFNNSICVINVHPEHTFPADLYQFDIYLLRALQNFKYNKQNIINKLKKYDIILLGDTNNDFSNINTLKLLTNPELGIPNGREFYGINKTKSCCSSNLNPTINTNMYAVDQILSTIPTITTKIIQTKETTSDHLPVIAIITNIKSSLVGGYNNYNAKYYYDKYLKYKNKNKSINYD